jgi:hypothetical protein
MLKLSSLILEKFEIPPELKNQLEKSAYSALGYILTPHLEKQKKLILSNKELNDKSYTSIKNVLDAVGKLTENGGNTKLTFTDVYIPEYYSVVKAKEHIKKVTIIIEKTGNDIYVDSDEKKDKIFYSMVISKDYAGWDLSRVNKYWEQINDGYQDFKKEFDVKLVSIDSVSKKLEDWKSLDKPRKPKVQIDGQKMALVYEKTLPTREPYEHYFRVMSTRKDDEYDSPDHFSGITPPYILQTVYLENFNVDSLFDRYVRQFIVTSLHEGRHLLQHYGNIQNKLKGDYYGGPKRGLRHQHNPTIRGQDSGGKAGPDSMVEPKDRWGRVLHPFRDVEFKTNLYNYKEDIEEFLNNNVSKNKWKDGFQDVIKYSAGTMDYGTFRKKYPFSSTFTYTIAKNHLEKLYKYDRPKFNQFVKELYNLIFNK